MAKDTKNNGLNSLFKQLKDSDQKNSQPASAEELEGKGREDDYVLGKDKKLIILWFYRIGAIILAIICIAFISAFMFFFFLYVKSIYHDVSLVKGELILWRDYILIVLSTLFVQNLFSKKK